MGKPLKILTAIIGVLAIIVVAAAIIVPMVVDPNDFKPQIVDAVKKNTGRDLVIEDELKLTVFPWLGINAGGVELGNAPGFDERLFARTEKVRVRVKLLPLLGGNVVMDTVTIHGLELNLARKADGSTNWDDLAATGETTATESDDDAPAAVAFAVGGLDVRDAALSWRDDQVGQAFQISNLSVETGALAGGEPVDLSLSFNLDGGPPEIKGRLALSGTLETDTQAGTYDASGLELEVDLQGPGLPGGATKLAFGASVSADMQAHTAAVRELVLTALGLELTGALNLTQLDTDPAIQGELNVAKFNLREMLETLGGTAIETADPSALTAVSFRTGLSGSLSNIKLQDVTLELDDTKLTGQASYGAGIGFDLQGDAIDADRYLPPETSGQAATPGAATASADLPVETLRALNIDGRFQLGKLKVFNLQLSEIALTLLAKDGNIRLSPVSAKLYEGSYAGDIGLDASGNNPKLTVNERLSDVQAGPLLSDLTGDERLTGTGNIEAKLTARGANPEAMKKTLNGTAAFSFTDGAIIGVNIAEMIRDAKATVLGGSAGPKGPQKTDFAELGGTAKVKDGLVRNDDFSAKSPLLRIEGKGTANLPTEALDYKVKTTIVATTQGQGGAELVDLTGVPIPVRVTGTFKEPSYGLDMNEFAALLAKSKVEGLVEGGIGGTVQGAGELLKGGAEGTGDLIKGGAEGVGGAIEGLFGN